MIERIVGKVGEIVRKKRNRDESGFTLMEMVIAIPIITLTGGFAIAIAGNSLTTINSNGLAVQAGSETNYAVELMKNSKTCHELRNQPSLVKGAEPESIQYKNDSFKIKSTFINDALPTDECQKNTANQIEIEATRDSDGKVLFKTTTAVYISE